MCKSEKRIVIKDFIKVSYLQLLIKVYFEEKPLNQIKPQKLKLIF